MGKAPDEREMKPDKKTALELSVRAYAEKGAGHVVNPAIGTSFNSLDEAYEFYNLYWNVVLEFGYVARKRCMQEIVCDCAVGDRKVHYV